MSRLIVHVEGVTEEDFVNAVLVPHLLTHGWEKVAACRIGRARSRAKRHGINGWNVTREGIIRHLQEDAGCCVTTCVDCYGMPETGEKKWPGCAEAGSLPFQQKATTIENAMMEDLCRVMGGNFNPNHKLTADYGTDARNEVFKALWAEQKHTPLWLLLRHGLKVRGLEFREVRCLTKTGHQTAIITTAKAW